uniref:G-protein coupled receptors family 1 profile domain-containing protein n=1 Tax=Canis lupus familiaris TaxID=9615 RepID=A0A8C0TI17_CANLF
MVAGKNNTIVMKFSLLGFSHHPQMKLFLFELLLGIYLLTLAWNLSFIVLIRMDCHLHTPMYFFLSNLSFLDICYVSSTTPKMLSDIITGQKTISFVGCATQYFVFCGMGLTECFLLAAMAYDPLISHTLCLKMVVGAYHDFCGPNMIAHFFCDLPPVLVLSCSDIFTSQVVNFIVGVVVGMVSVLVILISYGYIVAAVLKTSSAKGRTKAFSTCASHLTSVTLFYGSGLFMYMRPSSSYSLNRDKVVSIFYALVIPMVNPIIYSFRNKKIKNAMKKAMQKDHVLSHVIFFLFPTITELVISP